MCREFSHGSRLRDAVTSEVSLTASALSSAGHDTVILAGKSLPDQELPEQSHQKINIIRIPEQEIINPFRYTKLLDAISTLHCDVIVTYLSFMLFPKFSRLLSRLSVTAFHRLIHGKLFLADVSHALPDLLLRYLSAYGKIDFYDIARLLYPTFLLRTTSKTEALGTVITLSDRTRRALLRSGFNDQKVMTVPPAIAPIWFKGPNRERMTSGFSASEKKILYYGGGPSILRGIDTLIQSVRYLNDPDIRLEVYLRGSDRCDQKLMLGLARKLGLSSQVTVVMGFQEADFLVKRVHESDCVVLPFKLMAKVADVPLTVVEPMACGKPVISTSVGAIPEVVQHGTNGLLVRPSSAKQLSEAIISIVQNDSLRARFSSNARKSAELYRSDSVIGRLTNIYESV